MIFTSQYISLAAPTSGGVKKGFFAEGEAVQKKTMCGGPYPSHAGGGGAVFPKFATPMHRLEFSPSLPGMAHSATVRACHHCSTGNCKMSRRLTTWAPLHLQLPGPGLGLRKGNLSKSMEIQFYGPKTDTAGEYISTNQQPVTIATIIHIIVRLFFTRERKLL